jgi:putative ABC transport system permease protein
MPDWKYVIRAHFPKLDLSPEREREIVDEWSQHLEDRYRELSAAGKSKEEALRLALEEIEDDLVEREMRTLRQSFANPVITPGAPAGRLLADIWQDVVYACRILAKQRGFAAAAILTLALGIGVNTAVFSLFNAMLLRRLPVEHRERLAYLYTQGHWQVLSYPAYEALRDGNTSFEKLAAWGGIGASLNSDDETDLVAGAIVSGEFFDTLGIHAERGRLISSSDDVTPGAHPVAVISHRLWQTRFGGRQDIVGYQIRLNAQVFTIIGVTAPDFPSAQLGVIRDLYVPMMMQSLMRPPRAGYSGEMDPDLLHNPHNGWLYAVGLLKPGVSFGQAEKELAAVGTAYVRTLDPRARAQSTTLVPIDEGDPTERQGMLSVATLLAAVVGAILLIACANVANLLLSKAASRRRELAVRLAVGANRRRLIRQLLTESVLLALIGGAAGVGLAWAIVEAFKLVPPPAGVLPVVIQFALDRRVLLFTSVLSVATGIVFGLVPALQASNPNVAPTLKDESFVPEESGRRIRVKQVFVIAEVALTLVLLIAAGLFVRSLRTSQVVDPGIAADELLSAPININLLRYTKQQARDFYARVTAQVQTIPGVVSASVARIAVLTGSGRLTSINMEGRQQSDSLTSEGRGILANEVETTNVNVVGPSFLNTMGIPLLRGRDFTSDDEEGKPLVALVNEAFVRRFFPKEDALGKRFRTRSDAAGDWTEIVGIVHDSKYASLNESPKAVVYFPIRQRHETGVTLYIRASVPPETLVASVRHEMQALEPNLPVPNIQTMEETIGNSLYASRVGAWLIAGLGGLALILALLGVYGVMSFAISTRTREIGIRIALGADKRTLFGLVIGEGMLLVSIGVVVGLAGAVLASRTLSGFLFGISPYDPVTFAAVPLFLSGVALAACYLPARRAMAVDPVLAIKEM